MKIESWKWPPYQALCARVNSFNLFKDRSQVFFWSIYNLFRSSLIFRNNSKFLLKKKLEMMEFIKILQVSQNQCCCHVIFLNFLKFWNLEERPRYCFNCGHVKIFFIYFFKRKNPVCHILRIRWAYDLSPSVRSGDDRSCPVRQIYQGLCCDIDLK